MASTEHKSVESEGDSPSTVFRPIIIQDSDDSDSTLSSPKVTYERTVPSRLDNAPNQKNSSTAIPHYYSTRRNPTVTTPEGANVIDLLDSGDEKQVLSTARDDWDPSGASTRKRKRNDILEENQLRSPLGIQPKPESGKQKIVTDSMEIDMFVPKPHTPYYSVVPKNQHVSRFAGNLIQNRSPNNVPHGSPVAKKQKRESPTQGSKMSNVSSLNSELIARGKQKYQFPAQTNLISNPNFNSGTIDTGKSPARGPSLGYKSNLDSELIARGKQTYQSPTQGLNLSYSAKINPKFLEKINHNGQYQLSSYCRDPGLRGFQDQNGLINSNHVGSQCCHDLGGAFRDKKIQNEIMDSDLSDLLSSPSNPPLNSPDISDSSDEGDWDRPPVSGWEESSGLHAVPCRTQKQRERLENFHPELKSMWQELESLPQIGDVSIEQPQNISRELKPFQLKGVAWMQAMEKTDWGGGLLGDEMGMGKTIQAVTLIMSDWPAKQPTLVLIPPVALLQWQQEIEAYTEGNLKTFVYHGTNAMAKKISKQAIMKYNVILMSYNSLESMYRKQEKGFKRKLGVHKEKSVIHQIRFHRIILDEAHNIKSRNTGCAKACFALQADHKWCLSGTPLQNRIGEFFSLIRFLDIRPFTYYLCKQCPCSNTSWKMDSTNKCTICHHNGMQHVSVFNQELLNPIQKYGNKGLGAEAFRKLRILTNRFMLRRVKRDHSSAMELPAKEIYVDRQFFGEEENDFASSIMNSGTRKFETYVAQGVVLNNYANIFGLILQMRQVADHPDLVLKKNGEGGQNLLVCSICDETAEEAIRSSCRHEFCRECVTNYMKSSEAPDCPRCHIQLSIDLEQPEIEQDETLVKKSSIINRIKMENWTSSSKIEALVHDLYKLRSKNMTHKSIIFSQFTTMLQLVEWRLRRAGITTVMLDGTMTPAQRQASINHFMSNVNVECFLVSLKAGGVALNLTEASKVFIVDPWWNPAAEWQSADRCHRIGQARPCSITRLCIEDSVESRMVLLQEKKTNMINTTINADDAAMESLTPEDMQFLFRGLS
ncbi:DNA repair protein [Podosphaera aphanis]|nr:DNA repair protein [Podosphaera aphanis]